MHFSSREMMDGNLIWNGDFSSLLFSFFPVCFWGQNLRWATTIIDCSQQMLVETVCACVCVCVCVCVYARRS